MAAMAVYCGARPFALYTEPSLRAFLTAINNAYKPPTKERIAGPLPDDCYYTVKSKVDERLRCAAYLNFVTDESTNIQYKKRVNVCIHTQVSTSSLYMTDC